MKKLVSTFVLVTVMSSMALAKAVKVEGFSCGSKAAQLETTIYLAYDEKGLPVPSESAIVGILSWGEGAESKSKLVGLNVSSFESFYYARTIQAYNEETGEKFTYKLKTSEDGSTGKIKAILDSQGTDSAPSFSDAVKSCVITKVDAPN